MTRDTVGKIAVDLLKSESPTRDPIELEREIHKNYEDNIYQCIARYKNDYDGDFYIVVVNKKERLLQNVLRNYFFATKACPTPTWDQTVYKYHRNGEKIQFLWVIPDKETCQLFKDNAMHIAPEEQGLLQYVLMFSEGSLDIWCKKLNGEEDDSPFLEERKKIYVI